MKATGYRYEVRVDVDISVEELKHLIALGRAHAEFRIRAETQAPAGFLAALKERIEKRKTAITPLSFDQMNTICEILSGAQEPSDIDLALQLAKIMNDMQEESKRVNKSL